MTGSVRPSAGMEEASGEAVRASEEAVRASEEAVRASDEAVRAAGEIAVRPVRPEECAEAGQQTRAGFAAIFGEGDAEYLDTVADVAGRIERATVLVAVAGRQVLGSITVELTTKLDPEQQLAPGEAHLRMLGVAPSAQGRGAGRALLEGAAALAQAAGKTRLTLRTLPEMVAARRLYEAMGFEGGTPEEHAPGRVHFSYELRLRPDQPAG